MYRAYKRAAVGKRDKNVFDGRKIEELNLSGSVKVLVPKLKNSCPFILFYDIISAKCVYVIRMRAVLLVLRTADR